MDPNTNCPICGEQIPENTGGGWAASSNVQVVGGWRCCSHHWVTTMPSKFASRCHECLGQIIPGEEVVLSKEKGQKRWIALHRRDRCQGGASVSVKQPPPTGPYAKLFLAPGAPVEVVKAAYKALAMKFHPDRPGGDAAKMAEINAAIEDIVD